MILTASSSGGPDLVILKLECDWNHRGAGLENVGLGAPESDCAIITRGPGICISNTFCRWFRYGAGSWAHAEKNFLALCFGLSLRAFHPHPRSDVE